MKIRSVRFTPFLLLPVIAIFYACKEAKDTPSAATPTPASAASSATPTATAEPTATPVDRAARRQQRLKEMQSNLGLSDEQAQKIAALLDSMQPAMQALRDDKTLAREELVSRWEALRAEIDAKVSPLLTPEQKIKWDDERKRWRERIEKRFGTAPAAVAPPAPPASDASPQN